MVLFGPQKNRRVDFTTKITGQKELVDPENGGGCWQREKRRIFNRFSVRPRDQGFFDHIGPISLKIKKKFFFFRCFFGPAATFGLTSPR